MLDPFRKTATATIQNDALIELPVRAWDAAGQTQPALADDTWNFKGYLSAAGHRVPVVVA